MKKTKNKQYIYRKCGFKKKNDVSGENPIEFIAKECTDELNEFFAPFSLTQSTFFVQFRQIFRNK